MFLSLSDGILRDGCGDKSCGDGGGVGDGVGIVVGEGCCELMGGGSG